MISVIIPAHNEADMITACLSAVMASDPPKSGLEVIVIANGCTDKTAQLARDFSADRYPVTVLERAEGGKTPALNAGDVAAKGDKRAYLDADTLVSPGVFAEIDQLLDGPSAAYASGQVTIPRADSPLTRAFARFYRTVPFMTQGVPGCGLFAVNAAGRARWGDFPQIIADDTFVRLTFTAEERHVGAAPYSWPLVEGLRNLVKVRRRQDQGVREIARRFPDLLRNDDKLPYPKPALIRQILRDPISFAAYAMVRLLAKLGHTKDWSRGR